MAFSQSKIAVTITNPSEIHVCLISDYIEVEIRNITTSTVSGIETEIELPSSMEYVVGSVAGSGIAEKSTTNLNKPIFSVSNLAITQARTIKIRIITDCSIISVLNNGGLASVKTSTIYTGGSLQKTGTPLSIKQPSLQIQNITNQFITTDLGNMVIRSITVKNSGSGKVGKARIRRLLQSGVSFIGSSVSTSTSGDTIWTNLDSVLFKNVGNGDAFLSLNESISFLDTILIEKCSGLNIGYNLSWGCNNQTCQSVSASTNATINKKSPNLIITPSSALDNCMSSANETQHELVFYNNGNDTARNVDIDVFQSASTGYYSSMLSEILVSTVRYKKGRNGTSKALSPYKTNATVNTGGFSCLGSNPKGKMQFIVPNLAPGDSLIVEWKSRSCCPNICYSAMYIDRWKYSGSYKDQCDQSISIVETYGSVGFYQSYTMSKFNPTDIQDGEKKRLEYNVTRGYLLNPISTSLFRIELILPAGLSHSLSTNDFKYLHPNGGSWTPDYLYQSGDTVIAGFQGVPNVNLTLSELLIDITGDCGSSTSNKALTYSLNVNYNPDTTCSNNCFYRLYCDDDQIRLHCQSSCSAGLHFNGFEAIRTSYGKPDNNNDGIADASGSLDFDKIKRNRVMYGDTLQTTFRAKVYNAGSISNWFYGQATSKIDWGYYLDVADVTIRIYRTGNLLFNCNNIKFNYSTSGYNKTFYYDISYNNLVNSGCSLYSSFAYLSVDSIELEVKYVVNTNPGNAIRDLFFENDFYLSTTANPTASQKFQCDSFNSRVSLIGSYFTNYGKNYWTNNGCSNFGVSQNFYLSVGSCCSNYSGGNIFPYEYRSWAKLHEIILKKPEGFDFQSARFYQYRTAGTSVSAYDYESSITPTSNTSTSVSFDASSLYEDQGGDVHLSDDGFYGIFLPTLKANCKAQAGSSPLEYIFVFERLNNLGSGYDTIYGGASNDEIIYEPPVVELSAQEQYVYAQSDTVEWQVRMTNSATNAPASFVWLGALGNTNVELISITDQKTGSSLSKSSDYFTVGNLIPGAVKNFTIRAVYKDCNIDSLKIVFGFNCESYPTSIQSYPCNPKSLTLIYEPLNTRVEAEIAGDIGEVDLCEVKEYKVEIRNTSGPKVFGLYLDLLLRPGMTLNDTAWIFIDGSSDSTMVLNPQNVGANTYRWNIADYDASLKNNGLNGVNANYGYQAFLKFKMTTDCNFTSGSYFLLKPGGYLKCGKPVNAAFDIGDPIDIKGVVKPYYSAISLDLDKLDVCNFNNYGLVRFINLGPDSTGSTDKVIISFPQGMIVDSNYVSTDHNAPNLKPDYELLNGENVFEWTIPEGIKAGDSCIFDIKPILQGSQLSCDLKQIFTQAVVRQPVVCVADSSICNLKVATSSALNTDSATKNVLNLLFNGAQSVPKNGNEEVSLNYSIFNTGSNKPSATLLEVYMVYDQNQNDTFDSGDSIIAIDTVYDAISSNTSLTRDWSFVVNSKYTCDLIMHISDFNCVCDDVTISIPQIQLINAGIDTSACSNVSFNIGSKGDPSNSYSWADSSYVSNRDSSITLFTGFNPTDDELVISMILTTDKGSCSSNDTVDITLYPGMRADLKDTVELCQKDRMIIGEIVSGGVGINKSYQWSPLDSLNKPNSVRTYANPDTSTLYTITVVDAQNCVFKDSTYVKVIEKPLALFSVDDGCEDQSFTLTNTSEFYSSSLDSVHWTLGNLLDTDIENPSIFIDSAQSLTVSIYVRNEYGCNDTSSGQLMVYPKPVSSIVKYDDCLHDTNTLQATSTIQSGNYVHQWVIGADTLNGSRIQTIWASSGYQDFELITTSDRGCVELLNDRVYIFEKPDLSINTENGCLGKMSDLTLTYTNVSVDSFGAYQWDLGDGSTSLDSVVGHVYSDTGTYQIFVEAKSIHGCLDSAISEITIYPIPKADFIANKACIDQETILTDSSTISSGFIAKHLWDIDNGFEDGNAVKQNFYGDAGTYVVGLKVVSNQGCSDTVYKEVGVFYKEVPNITVLGNCENEVISISYKSLFADSLANAYWVIESDTFRQELVLYDFSSSGSYSVFQHLETNRGCVSDSLYTISINPAPTTNFNVTLPCEDRLARINSSSKDQKFWTLGDGNTDTRDSFDHVYQNLGNYRILLEEVNQFGCEDSLSKTISIENEVVPDFTLENVCVFDSFEVVNTSFGNILPISRALFDMDNGDVISEINRFKYAYQNSGNYDITLSISTNADCVYDTTKTITIYPLPTADFYLDPENVDIFNANIKGRDRSSGADSVVYLISDGAIYISRDFEHDFLDSGSYDVKQWVSSEFGCLDSFSRSVYITYAYKLFIPNAFSPNGDNHNPVFQPVGMGLKSYTMSIYNRWGEEIFRSSKPNQPWDGKDAMLGYYMYQIEAFDFKGEPHYYNGVVYLVE